MTAQQRREMLREILSGAEGPVSAGTLAAQLGVSRQIVVGDVALLRAGGCRIDATPRGYLLDGAQRGVRQIVACCHRGQEQLLEELYTVVDNGGIVEDVTIENPLYGEITGRLHIASRYDADVFARKAADQPESLLLQMTDGVHLHTLLCPDAETFRRIEEALRQKGLLYRP